LDYKYLILLAAVLITSIAALRKRLVSELQGSSLLVFHNSQVGIVIYSILFLPGTIIHELSHWLVAEILQVPTGKMEIMPDFEKVEGGEQRLGFVMTGKTDPFRSFLIGFAPFVTGTLLLILLGYLLNMWWGVAPFWQVGLVIYGLIVVSNSMIVSRQDARNWPFVAIFTVLVIFVLVRLHVSLPESFFQVLTTVLVRINQALGLTIGLNLAMIAVSYGLRRILENVTKQKIVLRR
jgi:hypothetical protein